jgi:gas vesicle protein
MVHVILPVVGLVVGAIVGGVAAFYVAKSRAKAIVAKAEADGEMIKEREDVAGKGEVHSAQERPRSPCE